MAAQAKSEFENQRDQWKNQADEIASKAGFSMFMRSGVLVHGFTSNFPHDATSHDELAERAVERVLDFFTNKLEAENLLNGMSGYSPSDTTATTFSSGSALDADSRTFGSPSDVCIINIELGLTLTALRVIREDIEQFKEDMNANGTSFIPHTYLMNYTNSFSKGALNEIIGSLTSDEHWDQKDCLDYRSHSGTQVFHSFKAMNDEGFHNAVML